MRPTWSAAVQSLLLQRFAGELHIVVVDDASTMALPKWCATPPCGLARRHASHTARSGRIRAGAQGRAMAQGVTVAQPAA